MQLLLCDSLCFTRTNNQLSRRQKFRVVYLGRRIYLFFSIEQVKDWHKGSLPQPLAPSVAAAAAASRSAAQLRGRATGKAAHSPSSIGASGAGSGGGRSHRRIDHNRRQRDDDDAGGGRSSPTQASAGRFGDDSDDDMMNDDDDAFLSHGGGCSGGARGFGVPGIGGSAAHVAGTSWDGGGNSGGSSSLGSQIAPSQGSGSAGTGVGGSGGGSGGGGAGADLRLFGEGKEPGGALKGSMVWSARLTLAISPNPTTASRIMGIFQKVGRERLGWEGLDVECESCSLHQQGPGVVVMRKFLAPGSLNQSSVSGHAGRYNPQCAPPRDTWHAPFE